MSRYARSYPHICAVDVSMQWITCPFCADRREIDWIQLPDSLPECCEQAKLRKKIHQRKFDDGIMSDRYYVEVKEYMPCAPCELGDILHCDRYPTITSRNSVR